MKKEYINILSIIVILFISVKIIKLNQEHFTDLKRIQSSYGYQGDSGESGIIGIVGGPGDNGVGNEQNVFLNDTLNLGKMGILSIPMDNDKGTQSYSQLTLSRKVSLNGIKLHIEKDEYERTYAIFCQDEKKQTDFYINNKEVFVNGDVTIDSVIFSNPDNTETRRIPDDIFPKGSIFPFYIDDAGLPTNGYYKVSSVDTTPKFIYYDTAGPTAVGPATADHTSTIYVEQNNNYTVYLRFMNSSNKEFYLSVLKDTDSLKFISTPNKSCEFKFIGGAIDHKPAIMSVKTKKFLVIENDILKCSAIDDTNKFTFAVTVPPGWIECDGTTVPDLTNHNLTNKIIMHKHNEYYFGKTGELTKINIQTVNTSIAKMAYIMKV